MTTRLIAIRHAKPEDPADYPDDLLRPLALEGRQTQDQMARELLAAGMHADRILTSPLLRAQQTAKILSHILGGVVEDEEGLAPPFDAERLLSRIEPGKTTLLVGHDPTLAEFVNMLLGERYLTSGMVKSGAVVIDFESSIGFGMGKLINYFRPK